MKFEFDEAQSEYVSGSQKARNWTERWVADWMYCPNCGAAKLSQFPANKPLADFYCPECQDQFEVKAKKGRSFGRSIANGAYHTKIERLKSDTSPNFILIGYQINAPQVHSVCVIPKHFVVPAIITKRPPLSPNARRAGWVGSNILLAAVPEAGRIYVVRNGALEAKQSVLSKWQKTSFLRSTASEGRGWLIEVMKVIDLMGRNEFTLSDIYTFEHQLGRIYPNNHNVRPKIRQQLQVLREAGFLEFLGQGRYRLKGHSDGVVRQLLSLR